MTTAPQGTELRVNRTLRAKVASWAVALSARAPRFGSGAKTVGAWTLLASFLILLNPQGLTTEWGTVNGVYPDRVDSFSEYIVRNTVIFNAVEDEDFSVLPILTQGYFLEGMPDLTYSGDGVLQYTSNLALQTVPLSLLASAFQLESESGFNAFFTALRVLQAVVLSLFLMTFTYLFAKFHRLRGGWIAPLAVGTSAGFVLFAENLYFVSPLMIAPAVLIAVQFSRKGRWSPGWLFVLSLANLLRGYEFLSVAALLTAFAAMVFVVGDWRPRILAGAKAFGIVVLAFLSALVVQILAVVFGSTSHYSVSEAIGRVLERVKERNLSTESVPSPLGNEFFASLMQEWLNPAFVLVQGGPSVSKFAVLLVLLVICVLRVGRATKLELTLLGFGLLGYVSWYVVGYQHIMVHRAYDWYIFSLTAGLAATLLLIVYVDRGARWWNSTIGPFIRSERLRTLGPS